MRYAGAQSLRITSRGSAHSQGGQSLCDDIVVDMRSLQGVERVADGRCVVASGTLWSDVVEATIAEDCVPPVLTSNLHTTVGGTLAVGGIGQASYSEGLQADQCIGAEVVTGAGDVVWCSAVEHRELWDHVRCGLGRFGIVTRVAHRVRKIAHKARMTILAYRDLEMLTEDLWRVVAEGQATGVSAWSVPHRRKWLHAMGITTQADVLPPCEAQLPQGMQHTQVVQVHELDPRDLARAGGRGAMEVHRVPSPVVRPGVDLILPAGLAASFAHEILADAPTEWREGMQPLLQPLQRRGICCPLFVTPPFEQLAMFSLLPAVVREDAARLTAWLQRVSDQGLAAGGTRYLAGWVPFTPQGWKAHYGARWPGMERVRRGYDPAGLFAGEFVGGAVP